MSNASRLQIPFSSIVRGDQLWGINYGMGQSFAYGGTRPGEKLAAAHTYVLVLSKVRARYIGVRFRGEGISGSVILELWFNHTKRKTFTVASTEVHDYLYIHDVERDIGDPTNPADVGFVNYPVEVKITAVTGTSFLRDVLVLAMRDNVFPLRFASDIFLNPD
jgi:hypothetical protein